MKHLEEFIAALTDKQLKAAYDELVEWKKTGILNDGLTRKIHEQYNLQGFDFPLYALPEKFFFEAAKRYFEGE
ncbi:hypothetical protein [Halalkalibacter oceani]|uniref:hypothetical protein n=1 Tax=Halalkalibacter oceani TaxID=1653776 RepID=UPI00339AD81E